jgi:hypothetical protein
VLPIDTDTFILHSIIYCVIFTLALVPIGLTNPRMMLQDYPKEIQKLVPPKTNEEKRMGIFFAIPLLAVLIGYPGFVAWYYSPEPVTFISVFTTMWGIMMVMNVFDLIVLDWIMFCAITPRFVVIKGTEGSPAYKDYMFHFIGFLKGIVITGVISAGTAAIALIIS